MEIWENLDLKDIDGEIWREISTYQGYLVSNLGRVKSTKYNLILRQRLNSKGYCRCEPYKNSKKTQQRVHRLVAFAFLGSPTIEKCYVNHKNGLKIDNRVDNSCPII